MSKIMIRLCTFVILVAGITAMKSFSYDSKDENQNIEPHSDAEKLAKCFDEKVELKITHLDRTTELLESLIFKFLETDNNSTNEVILTENINDYIKFVRQDLDELKNGFKNFNILNELFQKNMNEALNNISAVLAENIENLLNEKLISSEKTKLLSRDYDENLNCLNKCNSTDELPKSCAEATSKNEFKEGAYALYIPNSNLKPFYAFCTYEDPEQGVWTIIQRREDGSQNFNRSWADYKQGFGDVFSEYWIGLERLHGMTKDQLHELWILMIDYDGVKRYAKYSRFSIASESEDYKLTVEGYEGSAGDKLSTDNHRKFETYDRIQTAGCAKTFGGGWWYRDRYSCKLNGVFRSFSNREMNGIKWGPNDSSLKYVQMAIREWRKNRY